MDSSRLANSRIAQLTDADLHGVDLHKIQCRSCSGYGNCGFKTYYLYKGKVVSICNRTRNEVFKELGIIE